MKPVETYLSAFLERLDAQLNDLPPARRAEILSETQSHLEAMIAARRADGMGEDEAWQSAQNAFGEAETMGRELAREWKRAPRVETVGTPLTKREKMILWARPLLVVIILSGAFSLIDLEQLITQTWGHWLVAIISFSVFGTGFWRWRRSGGKCTPTMTFAWTTWFLMILEPNFDLSFSSQLHGVFWDSFFKNWSYMVLPFIFLSSILVMRESKKTMLWRQTPKYAENPMAAEELYRLSLKFGLAFGVTFWCIINLSMVSVFGLPQVALNCALILGAAFLYARFVIDKVA